MLLGGNATVNFATIENSGTASNVGSGTSIAFSVLGGTLNYTGAGNTSNRFFNLAGDNASKVTRINNNGTGALIFNPSSFIQGNTTIPMTVVFGGANANDNRISGAINDISTASTVSVRKEDAGKWILSGNNGYTGGTTINAGTLQIGSGATTGTLGGGAVANNAALVFSRSNATTVSNDISGSGTLEKLGGNTLTLTGNNSYTGGTSIANGVLAFDNGSLGSSGNITFTGNSTLQWNGTNTQDVSSRIVMTDGVTSTFDTNGNNVSFASGFGSSTSGALIKAGSGTLTLAGDNTYTGATTINNGTLSVSSIGNWGVGASPSSLGAPETQGNGQIIFFPSTNNPTLVYTGTGETTNRQLRLNSGNGLATVDHSGTGLLKFESAVSSGSNFPGTQELRLQGSTAGTGAIAGTINDTIANTRQTAVTKEGTGTWILSGTNGYTGGTNVNAGTLLTTKAAALPGYNLASRVGVASGATLAVNVDAGGWSSAQIDALLGATTAAFAAGSNLGIEVTSGSLTYDNDIGTTQADKGLVKSGPGTLTLGAANTYTGATTVSAGTLALVGGSQASAITVNPGASLGFTLGSPTTSTAAVTLNGTVSITGSVDDSSDYLLMTAASFTGTPTLSAAITGYELQLRENDTELWLAFTDAPPASPFDTWAATGTLGPVTFDGDANGDGVQDGLAFLLGAGNPDDDALGLLPAVSETGGGLVLTFRMRNAANRGTAALSVEHSSDLGIADAWAAVPVPESTPDPQAADVTFVITPNGTLNDVVATIQPGEAAAGKLFARLKATE